MNTTFLFIIEMLGTLAFAISGVRLAAAKQFDWFGAYCVGLVTAIGGGTLRDLLLGLTPFWMLNGVYLGMTAVSLGIVIVFGKYLVRLNNTFFIFDTIGLALFVVVGIEKSLDAGFSYWVAIVMGMTTGIVGSITRDILINEPPLVFRKELYALACVFGGMVYFAAFTLGAGRSTAGILGASTVIVTRLLAVKYQWGLPVLRHIDPEEQ